MRIQKYKICREEGRTTAYIYCDYLDKVVLAYDCKNCEHFVSVHPDKEEIICNAEVK